MRRAATAGALALMAWVLAPLTVAGAATSTASGAFTSPDSSTPSTTASPPITGHIQVNGCLSSIDLSVTGLDGQPNATWSVTIKGNGRSGQDFGWPDASRPTLTANGRYQATAR